MGIQGIMTVNGVEYKNSITRWGIKSLFRAMFDDVPFPTDLYLIVAGRARNVTAYPGQPYPYSYPFPVVHDVDTLGAFVDTVEINPDDPSNPFVVPYNIIDWDSAGNPLTPGFPPRTVTDARGFFEFRQDTFNLQRLKLTPFHYDGSRVYTDRLEFNCPEVVSTGPNSGDLSLFMLTDSPTMYNNNSRLFSVALIYDQVAVARAAQDSIFGASFKTFSFSEGAKFSYSFSLT